MGIEMFMGMGILKNFVKWITKFSQILKNLKIPILNFYVTYTP